MNGDVMIKAHAFDVKLKVNPNPNGEFSPNYDKRGITESPAYQSDSTS